jgi:Ca2+-binding EF-hand superfamily protein
MNSFHWLRAFLILLATCTVVVLLSSPAFAEGMHGKHHEHQCPAYSDIDANADDAVTPEEFYEFRADHMAARAEAGGKMKNAKNAPSFEDLDLDGDGNLSAEEFAEHQSQCPMKKKQMEAAATE